MFAVVLEVNANETHVTQARKILPEQAVPMAKEMGATGGCWLAPLNGHGTSVIVFDTEEAATKAAGNFKVGQPVGPVPEVTVASVDVREVLALF